jgi:hypothetical protein
MGDQLHPKKKKANLDISLHPKPMAEVTAVTVA